MAPHPRLHGEWNARGTQFVELSERALPLACDENGGATVTITRNLVNPFGCFLLSSLFLSLRATSTTVTGILALSVVTG